jgi:hypothetical protein
LTRIAASIITEVVMKRLRLTSMFGYDLKLGYNCIKTIKPDDKWSNITHIETSMKTHDGKPMWFQIKQNYAEILDMYYEVKKNTGRR